MKYLATLLLLSASILTAQSAAARPTAAQMHGIPTPLIVGSSIPVDWAGVWSISDSTYDCTGVFKSASSVLDTLCVGQTFSGDSTFVCTGSSTTTTYQETCTGGFDLFPDCHASIVMESHGTRTGESYYSVTTISTTYSGTGEGCNLFPSSCTQINTRGTRTGPAPAAYCATPARAATWGELKSLYR